MSSSRRMVLAVALISTLLPRETSSFFSRGLSRRVGVGGSVSGTQPATEWPPHDNGRCEDKEKIDAFGTLLGNGGGMSPPEIISPSYSPKSFACKHGYETF
jgi:hypothetical protein